MPNYHDKIFRPVQNTENGETSADTLFHYQQSGNILSAAYRGGKIIQGHLLGLVNDNGSIDMVYHQINDKGEIMTGKCHSIPEILPNGKIRLNEKWVWTSGDFSEGNSVIEEI